MNDVAARRDSFRGLHKDGCFAIPNPWDVGTARAFEAAGFAALATTSAGLAFSKGVPDAPGSLPLEEVLAHTAEIVAATELPVNADFQAGYANDPSGVAENVRRCVETGVAGLSIEDARNDPSAPLYDLDEAVERLAAARTAIDRSGADVLLTGRAECFLVGSPEPLEESIRRLRAYAEAGADVLFAPGIRTRDQISAVVDAVAPKPVNVLVGSDIGLSLADIAELGVRRVSVGSALARVAWGAVLDAARSIASEGSFEKLGDAAAFGELNDLFDRSVRPEGAR